MTASVRAPLLRPALEPKGDIKLRIGPYDANGARDLDVLRALECSPRSPTPSIHRSMR